MTVTAQQTATERALADRDRQFSLYRAAKRRQYEELFATPVHGEKLRRFQATLNHFGTEDAGQMLAFVQAQAWLHAAPKDFRCTALEMIGARIQRIRVKAGMPAFDDPLPGAEESVFQKCKRELGL
jgi:hypothetical protein